RTVRVQRRRFREYVARLGVDLLTVERTPHRPQQLQVIRTSGVPRPPEQLGCARRLPEPHHYVTHPDQRILVPRAEHPGPLERLPRPAVLLPRQSRVADPYVQIHRVGIEREPFLQRFQGGVIIALVVVTMRELVILLGAEEWVGHSCASFSEHESRSSGLARI